ncbi:MAG TPA: mechanosensitive ion channel [bacterium]|nr:mechanosensitive ion channel [bacterium]
MNAYHNIFDSLFAGYPFLETPVRIALVLAIAYILFFIGRFYILRAIGYVIKKSTISWDDLLFEKKVFHTLIHLIPILVVHNASYLFTGFETAVRRLTLALIAFTMVVFIARVLATVQAVYERTEFAKDKPIKGFFQIVTVIVYLVGLVLMAAILMGKSPVIILSGIGAMTAVFMLVFKDAILGFVSSLQMSLNNSIRKGDWIAMEKYGADGEVADISLYSLKVRNWNNTFTSIPTQKFLEESFTNWRGMQESGARRISRSVPLDMTSVRFVTTDEIARLSTDPVVGRLVARAVEGLGEQATNLLILRRVMALYLRGRTDIRQDLTILVRTLEPTHAGLPLQLYCFTATTVWEEYEAIQGELIEFLVAVAPIFGLRLLQIPSGGDVRGIGVN